jgi:hypothetical protein
MSKDNTKRAASRWASIVLSALPVLFLLFDGGMKLLKPPAVVAATVKLGYPESAITGIGIALLVSTTIYIYPRTAVLGAILLAGYLGGAVASQVRVSGTAFNILLPVLLSVLLWGGLWLRLERLRQVLPSAASSRP